MADLSNEPRKLEILRNSNLMSTELVGTHDEDMSSFSYAYKFVTNQGTFIACKFDVFTSDDIPQPEGWTGDNWTESKDFKKAWEAKVKDELLATRKNLLAGTLAYFRNICKGASDVKEALKDLLLADYDSDTFLNNQLKQFHSDKKAAKVWKSVKL